MTTAPTQADRPVDPTDIEAVARALQGAYTGYLGYGDASELAVAAIDTLIARGNHSPLAASEARDVGELQRDRLLVALERAAIAESALRALADECDNDATPGWEDRMRACIDNANRLLATRASEAAPDEWQRAVGGGHLLHAEAAPSSHDTYSKVVKALERAFIALGRAGGNTVESPYRAAWIDARDAIEAAAMTSTHGMEAAFTSEALSRRDELEMPGGTQYLDRFIGAMGLLCRSKPPREMCEQWLKHESEELQSFAASNARIYWMQGIGAIEAAQVLADNPEEGEGHEGYTDDYSRSAEAAPVAVWDAKPRNNVALADLLIREICETDPADPNADDTVCIGIDDLRLIIETCAIEAENIGVAGKEAVTLSDEELTLFAETDEQFGDCNETSTDYETLMRWANLGLLECEHFTVTDAGRALLAQRDASKAEGKS